MPEGCCAFRMEYSAVMVPSSVVGDPGVPTTRDEVAG
jgi:hypothetical protein